MAYRSRLVVKAFLSGRADASSSEAVQDLAASLPGFGPLTRIETDFGHLPAHALRERDRVRVRDGQFRTITRIDTVMLDEAFLERHPDAKPVLIGTGSLGNGLPSEPVLLAPGQKVLNEPRSHNGCICARDLGAAGIARSDPEQAVAYVVFSFHEPEDVCVGGLWLRVEPPSLDPDDVED